MRPPIRRTRCACGLVHARPQRRLSTARLKQEAVALLVCLGCAFLIIGTSSALILLAGGSL